MTNKVNMEEIIAYNMKAKSYCPYDLSVLRMPINICTEEQSFLTYESWRCFFTAKDLQEAWPVLKSALKEYGISCALDLDHCSSWRLRKFKCPNLLCHILEHSCTFVFKAISLIVLKVKGKHLFPFCFTLTTMLLRELSSKMSTL
ncbi:hypothetical protein PRUPE_6G351800 [Prunus persica]|uniref:Uncharacterized protein n=1 Tax=Prunus persica TaxID=3760 RepID=A0A251P0A9_PRUPE|nr:uncharacterized protein LOC109949772 isoform X1 [Prunus persica]ONI05023.1 hypothetical protein PRUPE_6G351800 [Prunus persica]